MLSTTRTGWLASIGALVVQDSELKPLKEGAQSVTSLDLRLSFRGFVASGEQTIVLNFFIIFF